MVGLASWPTEDETSLLAALLSRQITLTDGILERR
jgi:hypothetical protein